MCWQLLAPQPRLQHPRLQQHHWLLHPRAQAAQSRLDALENDNPDDAPDPFGLAEDDDEFVMEESEDDGEQQHRQVQRQQQQLALCEGD